MGCVEGLAEKVPTVMRLNRFLSGAMLSLLLAASATTAWAGAPTQAVALRRPFKAKAKAPGVGPLVTTAAGTAHLDVGHYTSVRDGALAMMKKYPPANHYYLALGRSPVSMYTFLKVLDADLTSTFPASDLRLLPNGVPPELEPQYFQHFEYYIPHEVLRGDRGDIVMFDRSHNQSGSSLARIKPALEKYLAQKGYKTKVVALGFAAQGPLMAGVDFMPTAAFPKVFLYFNGADHDEEVAPYLGKHTIGSHAVGDLTANPAHDVFYKAMAARMASDPQLDAALTSEPHLKAVLAK